MIRSPKKNHSPEGKSKPEQNGQERVLLFKPKYGTSCPTETPVSQLD